MSTPFYLNLGGIWIPLTGVQREVPVSVERGSSAWVSSGGRRRIQSAARAVRTWALSYAFADPSAVAWLAEAANGDAGPVWLLDRMAAQANMLDPQQTMGRFNGQPTINAALGVPAQTFGTGVACTRLVRQGQWYHLSGWTTATAGATLGVLTVGAEAPVNVLAPTGTGPRFWSVAFKPAADSTMSFSVSIAAKTTRLRLTESSVDQFDWIPGQNTPCRVSVSDPDGNLSLYREGSPPRGTYTVTVAQVG